MIKDYLPCQYPFCRKKATLIAFPLLYCHINSTDSVFYDILIYRIDGEAIGILKMIETSSITIRFAD